MATSLLTTTSRVESPFIVVEIGGYTFGQYTRSSTRVVDEFGFTTQVKTTFPNFVNSLHITKINGTVNTYTLTLIYAITAGDDPNKIDKILSKVSSTRKIKISYGDYTLPQHAYKSEEALITKVTSRMDIVSSQITYTITAVSGAYTLNAGKFTFGGYTKKPSEEMFRLLKEPTYGLQEVFYGMRDLDLVRSRNLIASDDKAVFIDVKTNVSALEYLNYLVMCMSSVTDAANTLTGKHRYCLTINDDFSGEYGGPYFTVTKVAANVAEVNSLDTYELEVGYPTADIITSITVNEDDAYSILYDYAGKVQQPEYGYRINDNGEFTYEYAPPLSNSSNYRTTAADETWWSQMVRYPITATISLKGLLRPMMLMTYIKVNVNFYGRKHHYSGTYVVTKEEDDISSSGFRTTLSLVRVGGVSQT